jgi:hypothetical protein
MNEASLQQAIALQRKAIIQHPIYNRLQRLEDLQQFTRFHVFAVWDFMSLLKSLQRQLTCITLPWQPVGSATTRYLINEIVSGEESDVDEAGNRTSHFELYLRAMEQLGADTASIEQLMVYLREGVSVQEALHKLQLPAAVISFCGFTFDLIEKAPAHVQAAVFTFGREDLIPVMFYELVSHLSERYPEQLKIFKYYLERHIEVDGDHHRQLALEMVRELCDNDPQKWLEATNASVLALQLRKELWDGVVAALDKKTVLQ